MNEPQVSRRQDRRRVSSSGGRRAWAGAIAVVAMLGCSEGGGSTPAPLLVASLSPAPGLEGVPVDAVVTAGFSATLDCAALSATTFSLSRGTGAVTAAVSCSGTTATLTPSAPMSPATVYAVTLAPSVASSAGGTLGALVSWTFTTAAAAPTDSTPPTVQADAPVASATDVSTRTTVTARFSEPVDCSSVNAATFTLASAAGAVGGVVACSGSAAVFTPLAPLDPATLYVARVDASARDLAGNAMANPASWTFTTAAACAPSLAQIQVTGASVMGQVLTLSSGPVSSPCSLLPAARYSWSVLSRPSGSAAAPATPAAGSTTFVPDVAGHYVLGLAVTDATGASSQGSAALDVVTCGVAVPVLVNGPLGSPVTQSPATITNVGEVVTLAVANVIDPNVATCGAIPVQPYAYRWALLGAPLGSRAVLTAPDAASPSLVPDLPGNYLLSVSVTDALGNASATAFYTLTVSTCGSNAPVPTVAPSLASGIVNGPVALSGTYSDPDESGVCPARLSSPPGSATLRWRIIGEPSPGAGHLSSEVGGGTSFVATQAGTYTVELSATDVTGLIGTATGSIVVSACGGLPPVPTDAGGAPAFSAWQQIGGTTLIYSTATVGLSPLVLRHAIVLGANLVDPDFGPACAAYSGLIPPQTVSYAWRLSGLPAGSAAALTRTDAPNPEFVPDVAGDYTATLVATDSTGASSVTSFPIPVGQVFNCGGNSPLISLVTANPPPLQNGAIGLSATVTDADVTLCGLTDPLTYAWSFAILPVGSQSALRAADTPFPSFVPDVAAVYVVQLVVTDSTGLSTTASLPIDASAY